MRMGESDGVDAETRSAVELRRSMAMLASSMGPTALVWTAMLNGLFDIVKRLDDLTTDPKGQVTGRIIQVKGCTY